MDLRALCNHHRTLGVETRAQTVADFLLGLGVAEREEHYTSHHVAVQMQTAFLHTSAYVSSVNIRQHTAAASAYGVSILVADADSIPAYVSIRRQRQHT